MKEDLSAKKRLQETLRGIHAAVDPKLGSEFFDTIVRHLSMALDADVTFIGRLDDASPETVATISTFMDGEPGEPFSYALGGTPCQDVLDTGACVYEKGVADLFPEDRFLEELGIEGYVGIPLETTKGSTIGIMVALFRNPVPSSAEAQTILEIFAARTTAELERLARHERMQALEKAVDSSGEAIFMTDPEGVFTYVNPQFTRMYGFTPEEVVGVATPRILKSGVLTQEVYQQFWESLLKGDTVRERLVNRSKDGVLLPVDGSASPILGEEGEILGFLAIQRDITDREEAERALRESEEHLRSIFRVAPVGIGVVRDRVLLEVNELVCDMVGRSRGELLGQSSRILYGSDEEFDRVGSRKYEQIRKFGTGTVETRWQHRNGRFIDVLLSSTPIVQDDLSKGVTFTAMDITQRKQAEEGLRDSEQRFRSVIEQSNDAIYILYEGRFDLVNQRFLELTGVTPEAISDPDFSFWSLVAPESLDTIQDRQERRERGEEVPGLYDFSILRPDGTRVQVEASVKEIDYRGGRAVLGLLRDVSEQQALEDRLRQAQKMESLGRLSGGVAHDLNNLLTPILGYGDMMLEAFAPDDRRREFAEQIVEAGTRSRDLIRQLLAFSRRQTLEFRSLDMNHLVDNFRKLLRRAVREDIKLEMDLAPNLPPVRADVVQLEQVIMNLAVNAEDAMPDGGRLTIQTSLSEGPLSEPPGSEEEPAPMVSLTIRDTGHGMDPTTAQQVFEPFFTTKTKGTGLGLATVYGIVKQHGGNIRVESEPGKGTAFHCDFPASTEAMEGEGVAAEITETPPADGQTILVVEDEEGVRKLAVDFLSQKGYTLLSAGGGDECLELLKNYAGPLDLLLTDVVLPGMNGRALAEEVLARHPGARVLFMSGYTDEVITHHGVLDEGIEFIQKPFSIRLLAQRVREVLGS